MGRIQFCVENGSVESSTLQYKYDALKIVDERSTLWKYIKPQNIDS